MESLPHLSFHMLKFYLTLFLGLLSISPAVAQQDNAFTSKANLVPVPTLVRASDGRIVEGLRAEDFIIEDDGVEQRVHLDEDAEHESISLMIAVQCGRRAQREFGRISTLGSMLDPVLSGPGNEAAVLFFDSKLNLVQDFVRDPESIEAALKNLPSGDGGAAILDAVAYAARLLGRREDGRQRVLLLISETRDHGSRFAKLDEVVRLIDGNNVSVYALPFSPYISKQLDTVRGSNKDEWSPVVDILEKMGDIQQAMRKNTPKALASFTGGEYELFSSREGFESEIVNFTNHLHSRYRLSFEPKEPHPGSHQVRVRLRDPGKASVLLSRTCYWMAGQTGVSGP